MSTASRNSQIGKEDLRLWDGVSRTYDRTTSTGGTLTLNKIGDVVDVLALYGSGTDYSDIAISKAMTSIGSSQVTLHLAPGVWVIDNNLTIPSTCVLEPAVGATIKVKVGKTLTIPIFSGKEGILYFSVVTGYTGTILITSTPVIRPDWWYTSDMMTALSYAITAVSQSVDGETVARTIQIPIGEYAVNTASTVMDSTTIITGSASGAVNVNVGNVTIKGHGRSTVLTVTGNGRLITFNSDVVYTSLANCRSSQFLKDITFKHVTADKLANTAVCVDTRGMTGPCGITGCEFHSFYFPIHAAWHSGMDCSGNVFNSCAYNVYQSNFWRTSYHKPYNVSISNNRFVNHYSQGILSLCDFINYSISGNYFYPLSSSASAQAMYISGGAYAGFYCLNITNNTIYVNSTAASMSGSVVGMVTINYLGFDCRSINIVSNMFIGSAGRSIAVSLGDSAIKVGSAKAVNILCNCFTSMGVYDGLNWEIGDECSDVNISGNYLYDPDAVVEGDEINDYYKLQEGKSIYRKDVDTDRVQECYLTTEAYPRYTQSIAGKLSWSDGTGSADCDLYRSAASTLRVGYGTTLYIDGEWDQGRLRMNEYYLWVEAGTGKLRIKLGAPTSGSDGTVVGAQTA